eukprot:GILJ01015573.1.p1 GENE.GILJ01015573.1~~GILJ01015573.1.p1  ORF type:complete len:373 (-),score=52.63 GILJ01015573.1:113-1231(-)
MISPEFLKIHQSSILATIFARYYRQNKMAFSLYQPDDDLLASLERALEETQQVLSSKLAPGTEYTYRSDSFVKSKRNNEEARSYTPADNKLPSLDTRFTQPYSSSSLRKSKAQRHSRSAPNLTLTRIKPTSAQKAAALAKTRMVFPNSHVRKSIPKETFTNFYRRTEMQISRKDRVTTMGFGTSAVRLNQAATSPLQTPSKSPPKQRTSPKNDLIPAPSVIVPPTSPTAGKKGQTSGDIEAMKLRVACKMEIVEYYYNCKKAIETISNQRENTLKDAMNKNDINAMIKSFSTASHERQKALKHVLASANNMSVQRRLRDLSELLDYVGKKMTPTQVSVLLANKKDNELFTSTELTQLKRAASSKVVDDETDS